MRLVESSARVEEAVSGIRRDIDSLRRDFSEEKTDAHESRKAVGEKIETVENSLRIVGATAAQTRDIVEKQVMPVVAEFTAIKWKGAGMLGAATIAGGLLMWAISTFGASILARLGFHF